MNSRITTDLIRIAAAGGGFRIDGPRTTNDLIRIAAAAADTGAKIIISKASAYITTDVIRIAAAGKGCVFFEE